MKKAFLFSAGLGTRLRPYTNETPKPLLKIYDKPIIEYQIEYLHKRLGITDITINTFYLKEQFKYLVNKYLSIGINLKISSQPKLYMHAGDLAYASEFIKSLKENEKFLAVNSDTLFSINSQELLEFSKNVNKKSPMLVLGFQSETNALRIHKDKIIGHDLLGFYDKDFANLKYRKGDSAGIQILHSSIMKYLPGKEKELDFYKKPGIVEELIKDKNTVLYYEAKTLERFEIGTTSDYENYRKNTKLKTFLENL